jgi:hypothetical protein
MLTMEMSISSTLHQLEIHLYVVPSLVQGANTTTTEVKSIGDLSAVLEQLAITTATAIKSYGRGERDLLFQAFVTSLDGHLGGDDEDSPILMGFSRAGDSTTAAEIVGSAKEGVDNSS